MLQLRNCLLVQRSIILSQRLYVRNILSTTGNWPKEYTPQVRKEVETHWKPKIKELDRLASKESQNDKEKFYVLSMFPYPSGNLHMGHVRVYTISDAMARYHRATGKHVIHPMGWDAFGLPAENAAIDRNEEPASWTYSNIDTMRKQMEDLCFSFEYDRGFETCNPDYYMWTQFLFIKLYENGLAYQKEGAVNWDPVDQTVLADEQIDENGCSWRSGAKVERKFLKQWYIKTSAYAKSMIDGLDEVDSDLWHDIKDLQRGWIGDITGVRFEFQLYEGQQYLYHHFSVFTKQPEGLYGVSHILLSPDHFLNQEQYHVEDEGDVIKLNLKVMNFFKGNMIPLYVHKTYDFGEHLDSHMAIPSLNPEDMHFAESRELRYIPVVHKSGLIENSGKFSKMTQAEAAEAIAAQARKYKRGGHWVSEKHRDWCISRQRYWGTPIPMLHCPLSGKAVPVAYNQLPVLLPKVNSLKGANGKSPLATADDDWLKGFCPKSSDCPCDHKSIDCCKRPLRETDTMDTFVDSSWYFLRYLSPRFNDGPFNPDDTSDNIPVDLYIGGKEHAIMHLYYARFFAHFLHDLGWLPVREPFKNLLAQGMVRGQSYRVKETGKYIPKEQVDFSGDKPTEKSSGAALTVEWEKMSKSKYNGVDPQEVLSQYGADTTRLCVLGGVAPKSDRNWNEDVFVGIENWQEKIWHFVTLFRESKGAESTRTIDPEMVKKYNSELWDSRNYFLKETNFHLNHSFLISTAISRLQGLTNTMRKIPSYYIAHCSEYERCLNDLVVMVSVFAPMFGAELRHGLEKAPSVIGEWPVVDKDYRIKLTVRVNEKQAFSIPIDVPLEELDTVTKPDAMKLVESTEEWKTLFGARKIDYTFFHVTPMNRAELHVLCNELKKEKKAKRKAEKEAAAKQS